MLVLLLALATAGASFADNTVPEGVRSLYETGQWFALRDVVARGGASDFYRGAVALSFHDVQSAKRTFASVIKVAPSSWEATEAHRLLARWYAMTGRHQLAAKEYGPVYAAESSNRGVRRELRERELWSRFPDMTRRPGRSSTERFLIKDGDLFLPLLVNGKGAKYLIDTGANNSVISESEARRLGLRTYEATGVGTNDGLGVSSSYRMAMARLLDFGGLQLRNVPFLVVSDEKMPFAGLPSGWRGILGLPVLLAWETVKWNRDGQIEAGFPTGHGDRTAANMCFSGDGPHLLVTGEVFGKRVQMFLDTGASTTSLLAPFATTFPEVARGLARKDSATITAMSSKAHRTAKVLCGVPIRIGLFTGELQNAELFEDFSPFGIERSEVLLGSDLLRQAYEITIDFRSMQLTLR